MAPQLGVSELLGASRDSRLWAEGRAPRRRQTEAHAGPGVISGRPAWFSAQGQGLESFQVGDSEAWGSLPLGAGQGPLVWWLVIAWSPSPGHQQSRRGPCPASLPHVAPI